MESNTKFNGFYSAKLALLCLSMVLLFAGKTQTQAMTTTAVIDQLQKLTDTNRQNRLEAIKTLKTLGSPAVPILVEALSDDHESIRRGAAFALGAMAQDAVDAVPALLATLKDPVSAVRMDVAVALKQITTASPEALQQTIRELTVQLNHADTATRQGAAFGLGVIGSEASSTVPPLMGALKDRDEEVRLAAAMALKRMGSVAVPALKEALNDPDAGVRARAAFALGNIQASGITGVTQALQNSDRQIRQTAAMKLDQLTANQLLVQQQNKPGVSPQGNRPLGNCLNVINRPDLCPTPQGNQPQRMGS